MAYPYRKYRASYKAAPLAQANQLQSTLEQFINQFGGKNVPQRDMKQFLTKWIDTLRQIDNFQPLKNAADTFEAVLSDLNNRVPVMNRTDEIGGFWNDFRKGFNQFSQAVRNALQAHHEENQRQQQHERPSGQPSQAEQQRTAAAEAKRRQGTLSKLRNPINQLDFIINSSLAIVADAAKLNQTNYTAFNEKYNSVPGDPFRQLRSSLKKMLSPAMQELTALHSARFALAPSTADYAATVQEIVTTVLGLLDQPWQTRQLSTNLTRTQRMLNNAKGKIDAIRTVNQIKSIHNRLSIRSQVLWEAIRMRNEDYR